MTPTIEGHNLFSMIKEPTYFKSREGNCIDLMLTNRKHCFFNTQTFKTGLSDHHVMIYTMFKTTYVKIPPKVIRYRCYKNFSDKLFYRDLEDILLGSTITNFDEFGNTFSEILNRHASMKVKVIRGNHKPFVDKILR